jgi:hypothetical protein
VVYTLTSAPSMCSWTIAALSHSGTAFGDYISLPLPARAAQFTVANGMKASPV